MIQDKTAPSVMDARDETAFIPVYTPNLSGREREYVLDCVDSGWISSIGKYVDLFQRDFAKYTASPHAIAVSNGTVALHLALHCLGIGPGDEVIVPTFTYIASVNTIAQTGARPVFVDSRASDWLVCPEDIERKITARTKAIMVVHLYGSVCDMPAITAIAAKYDIPVVEDCAEALGSTLDGRHVGTFGTIGTFSFFGNKTVTTGEGGMVICSDDAMAQNLAKVKGQGQSADRRYWHDEIGFNYRMTNICAAIGLAQMERVDEVLKRKAEIASHYRSALADSGVVFQPELANVQNSNWLVSFLLPSGIDRDAFMTTLRKSGIDSRPVFYCAHTMPMYWENQTFRVAEDIASRGVSVPSYPDLTTNELSHIVQTIKSVLAEMVAPVSGSESAVSA